MLVQINSDKNVFVNADISSRIEAEVGTALARFAGDLTRVEVHLRDDSAGRSTTDDIRCLIEARPTGQQPVAVTENAQSVTAAVTGAVEKLEAMLGSKFGRLDDKDLRHTIRGS